jgi:hypothetical protein
MPRNWLRHIWNEGNKKCTADNGSSMHRLWRAKKRRRDQTVLEFWDPATITHILVFLIMSCLGLFYIVSVLYLQCAYVTFIYVIRHWKYTKSLPSTLHTSMCNIYERIGWFELKLASQQAELHTHRKILHCVDMACNINNLAEKISRGKQYFPNLVHRTDRTYYWRGATLFNTVVLGSSQREP